MKNKFRILSIFLIFILLFSVFPVSADDSEVSLLSEDEVEAITEEVETPSYTSGDVYIFENEVTIDTPVDGNAFICANNVTINTSINGDVFVCAKNIVIGEEAIIYSNLFSVSENVEIRGIVNEAFSVSQTFSILGGYVYRDLKLACNTLELYGSIGRNAYIDCEKINFDTEENLSTAIYGDLNYISSNELTIPKGLVEGNVNFKTSKTLNNDNRSIQEIILDYTIDGIAHIILVLSIALIILWLAPKFTQKAKNIVANKKGSTIGFGILGLLITPIVCIILLILNVTSPVSLLLLLIYILALIISKTLSTIVINNCICDKLKITNKLANLGILSLVALLVWAIGFIPYIGGFISFVLTIIGLGILILSIMPEKDKTDKTVEENS